MAVVGFDAAKISILDDNEKVTDTFTIDRSAGGTIEANISGLAPNMNVVYASNVPFYVSAKGTSEVKCELTVADLDDLGTEAVNKILGREQDSTTKITKVGVNTTPPYCVLELISKDKQGKGLYLGLLKGKFTFDGEDIKTSDNNGSQLSEDKVTMQCISRKDGYIYAKAKEADGTTQEDFEKFIMPAATNPAAG